MGVVGLLGAREVDGGELVGETTEDEDVEEGGGGGAAEAGCEVDEEEGEAEIGCALRRGCRR